MTESIRNPLTLYLTRLAPSSQLTMRYVLQDAADRLCDGKLVMVHEGGYAESYVPFCGLAVMEQLT